MSDTTRVLGGSVTGIDGLADTPIYLAMTAAATPIFHAMTVARTSGHRARPARSVPPPSRHRATVDDEQSMTVPIPIQSRGPHRSTPDTGYERPGRRSAPPPPSTRRSVPWPGGAAVPVGSRLPDPGASWDASPRRTGRHRLLAAVSS